MFVYASRSTSVKYMYVCKNTSVCVYEFMSASVIMSECMYGCECINVNVRVCMCLCLLFCMPLRLCM